MPFTEYTNNLPAGREGDMVDGGLADDLSRVVTGGGAAQVNTITITAQNSTLYTLTLNSIALTYTSDSDATKAEIAAGLIAALLAEPALSGLIYASIDGSDNLVLTSRAEGIAFSVAVGANLSNGATTANGAAAALPFGRAVVADSTHEQGCALVSASAFTAKTFTFTPTAANTALYRIVFDEIGVGPQVLAYTSDGDATVQEIVEGLAAAFGALSPAPDNVTASENDTTFVLTTSAGALVEIREYTSNLALAESADVAGDELAEAIIGVTVRQETEDPAQTGGVDGYAPRSTARVRRLGRVRVVTEDAAAPGKPVYVRVVANGANDVIGRFRATPDDGAVLWPGKSWAKAESATRAQLQL